MIKDYIEMIVKKDNKEDMKKLSKMLSTILKITAWIITKNINHVFMRWLMVKFSLMKKNVNGYLK